MPAEFMLPSPIQGEGIEKSIGARIHAYERKLFLIYKVENQLAGKRKTPALSELGLLYERTEWFDSRKLRARWWPTPIEIVN